MLRIILVLMLVSFPAYANTTTTNYTLNKPAVNDPVDEDIWGEYLNDNFDSLDTLIKTASDFVTSSVSTTHTGTTSDQNKAILCDASGGAFDVDLVASASAGSGFTMVIKKTDSSSNAITIDPNSSETIDGAASYTLSSQYDAVIIVNDGSNWHVVAKLPNTATTSAEGLVEKATQAEVEAETTEKYPDSALIRYVPSSVKVSGQFDGFSVDGTEDLTGVSYSYNVASVVDNGTGSYTVNIDDDFSNTNYACVVSVSAGATEITHNYFAAAVDRAAGSFRIDVEGGAGQQLDAALVDFMCMGDQ